MKKFNIVLSRLGSVLTALALTVGVSSMNSACCFWFKQPKAPDEMKKYIK